MTVGRFLAIAQTVAGISLAASVLSGVFIQPFVEFDPRPYAIGISIFVAGVTGWVGRIASEYERRRIK